MNQVNQNINKDMFDSDLIDVESLDFSNDQTWLCTIPGDSGQNVDIMDWTLSFDSIKEDEEYLKMETEFYALLDNILKNQVLAMPDKHKFDSRTYVKPKKRPQRPSIQNIMEVPSSPSSLTSNGSLNHSANKYLTYNKYSTPMGPISPMLRLKTFNVDTNTDNSSAVKEYAMKRKSLVQDDDPQLVDGDENLSSEMPDRLSSEQTATKPINIDFSQPAHNLHTTFNRGFPNIISERGSLNMYQSGESLMRMSPPSLVSSLLMENSGTFNPESLDSKKSIPSHKDSGIPTSGRDSIDPMVTSMTLSILDEKDMNTSFLSQTTYPDNDSLIDSMPPSLVSSVNSSYIVSNTSKPKDTTDSNIFSSATFTHLEQSERLLTSRPRCHAFNTFTKRESGIRNSESYTKSREEASQIDTGKVLNENNDKKDLPRPNPEMGETITLHYANNKFRQNHDAEKENLNSTFQKDDAFYNDMDMQKTVDLGKKSLNVTLDKQELNEIIQARQKLSLARKGLPVETEKPLPNQVDTSMKTIQLPNQIITVPKQSMENASELLSRRRAMNVNNGVERQEEPTRDMPKRSATFKKMSPKSNAVDTTLVYVKHDDNQIIDINSATLNLIDSAERVSQQDEWCPQERAMVGSNESTDTGTFSSSSPPESVPDGTGALDPRTQVASTPLMSLKKGSKNDLLNLHNTISPIFDVVNDKSYTLTKAPSSNSTGMERTYDMHSPMIINSATMVKKPSPRRDIMAGKTSPDGKTMVMNPAKPTLNRLSPTNTGSFDSMAPTHNVQRKTGLPTSKLRQYSSHRELNRIPGGPSTIGGGGGGALRAPASRTMLRRGVYASNPALSPTASVAPTPFAHPTHPAHNATSARPAPPLRRDSYTIALDEKREEKSSQKQTMPAPTPVLIRQGTETLRRERPQSQLVAPRDLRAAGGGAHVFLRSHQMPPPTTRPYSVVGMSQVRVPRPVSGPVQKPAPVATTEQARPASSTDGARVSALPRPSRLPAPRRAIRPPSEYSVAPATDMVSSKKFHFNKLHAPTKINKTNTLIQ